MPISRLDLPRIIQTLERFYRALEAHPKEKPRSPLGEVREELLGLLMPSGVNYNFDLITCYSDIQESDLDVEVEAVLTELMRDCLTTKGSFMAVRWRAETLVRLQGWLKTLRAKVGEERDRSSQATRTNSDAALRRRIGRPKKDETPGDLLVLAALERHHRFDRGRVGNPEPASVADIVALAGAEPNGRKQISPPTVTRFFQKMFEAKHAFRIYQVACRAGRIGGLLATWTGTLPARRHVSQSDAEDVS